MNLRSFLSSDFVRIAFQRFPEALVCAALGTLIGCGIIAEIIDKPDALTGRILYLCSTGFVWFLIMRIAAEARSFHLQKGRLIALCGFAAFACFVIIAKPPVSSLAAFFGGLTLLLLAAPFLKRESRNASVWGFCHDLSRSLFFAFLLGNLFSLGVWLIELSLEYLFSLELGNRFMLYVWSITHGFVVPAYFLARLPSHYDYPENCELPKDVRIISSYICIPFVWIYLLILYAYMAKIVILGKLPTGQLGWMISLFGIAGILTHLIAYPLRESGNALARSYYRWFYPALLLPIGLLALALYSRIEPYGITGSRYLMVLVCLWFTIVALYFTRYRTHGQLRVVPLTLAILLMATSFGPLGIAEYPLRSQMARLTGLLEKNHLLKDGKLSPANENVPLRDRREITSVVDYLSYGRGSTDDDFIPLTQFMGEAKDADLYDKTNSYSVREEFFRQARFRPVNEWDYKNRKESLISQSFNVDGNIPLSLRDYEIMLPVSFYSSSDSKRFSYQGHDYVVVWREKGVLEITREKTDEAILLPLLTLVNERLQEQALNDMDNSATVDQEKLWFSNMSENMEVGLQINTMTTKRKTEGKVHIDEITSFSGFLLLREKP